MSKTQSEKAKADLPIDGMLLECNKDRYKLSYSAIRWAKEIKQKENLPDSIPVLLTRSLREILGGKVSIKDVEKLPFLARTPSTPAAAPAAPTLSLNVNPSAAGSEEKA